MSFSIREAKYKVYFMNINKSKLSEFKLIFKNPVVKRRLCELSYGCISKLIEDLGFEDVIFCKYHADSIDDIKKYIEKKIRFFEENEDICWFIYEENNLISDK